MVWLAWRIALLSHGSLPAGLRPRVTTASYDEYRSLVVSTDHESQIRTLGIDSRGPGRSAWPGRAMRSRGYFAKLPGGGFPPTTVAGNGHDPGLVRLIVALNIRSSPSFGPADRDQHVTDAAFLPPTLSPPS